MDCGPGSLTDASGSESRVIGSAVFQGQSLLKKHTHTQYQEKALVLRPGKIKQWYKKSVLKEAE